MLETTNFNTEWQAYDYPQIIDESVSGTTYVGTSQSFAIQSAPVWKIKKTWIDGGITYSGYPSGGTQTFEFIWDNRASYTYQ